MPGCRFVNVVFAAALLLAFGPRAQAQDEAVKLVQQVKPPARFASHTPRFSHGKETFVFTPGGKEQKQDFLVIKDGDKYVAVLHEGMAQLDMITFDPTKAPSKPPFQEYYSWGKLLGTRITTTPWYGGMSVCEEGVKYEFTGGGKTLTLTTTARWTKDRKAEAKYVLTLRCDPVLGYVWDIDSALSTSKGVNDKGQPDVIEFVNWQVKVTEMGQRNNQRWPVKWDHERTVFLNGQDKLVGFYINPEANDRSKFKRTEVKNGGYVAKLPGPEGWGTMFVHVDKAPFGCPNATCNMWADQHNSLRLPEKPDSDGMFRAKAKWRLQAIPPEAVQEILKKVEMDNLGHGA